MTATLSPEWVYFQVAPSAMTWVTRFVEGCEYFGVVTAVWGKKGIGCVRTTADTREITTAFFAGSSSFRDDSILCGNHENDRGGIIKKVLSRNAKSGVLF